MDLTEILNLFVFDLQRWWNHFRIGLLCPQSIPRVYMLSLNDRRKLAAACASGYQLRGSMGMNLENSPS